MGIAPISALLLLPQTPASYSCFKLQLLVELHDRTGKKYGLNIKAGTESNISLCKVLQ